MLRLYIAGSSGFTSYGGFSIRGGIFDYLIGHVYLVSEEYDRIFLRFLSLFI